MLQVQTNEDGYNQLVSDTGDNGDSSFIDVMTNNDFVDASDEVSPMSGIRSYVLTKRVQ